ncbi:hypothetical protein [Oceanobacillus sojae]|uniref:hypothetical protein n=1 Tax=Oceanobacillus sojae TaxID=582851 RepID=UPI0009885454|nr:hypothetical protein [Oceanobacillus sojae]
MFEFIACIAVIVSVSWAIFANAVSSDRKASIDRLEREVENLEREQWEGKKGEVLIGFNDGKINTFDKVYTINEEGIFSVLRDYDDRIIVKVRSEEIALISPVNRMKGDD